MSVDIEALLTNHLRATASVTAIVADRVYTDLPHDRTYPLVLLNRTGGGYTYKSWLEAAEIELSTFGGTHKQAQSLMSACLGALTLAVGQHPEGVVTKATLTANTYEPEPDSADPSGHARPRFLASVTVLTHPIAVTAQP